MGLSLITRRECLQAHVSGMVCLLGTARMPAMASQSRPDDVIALVGARLRAAREVIDPELKSKEMAAALHVAENTYSQWETGARLADPLAMARLGDIYGIGLDWIYRGRLEGLPERLARALVRRFPHLVGSRGG